MKKSLHPLVVTILDSDVTDDQLINEMLYLRLYLRNPSQTDISERRKSVYKELGLGNKVWDDLIVLDPGGVAITLPSVPKESNLEFQSDKNYKIVNGHDIINNYLTKVVENARLTITKSISSAAPEDKKELVKTSKPLKDNADHSFARGIEEVERMYKKSLKETFLRLKDK